QVVQWYQVQHGTGADRLLRHDGLRDRGEIVGGLLARRAGTQAPEHPQEMIAVGVHVVARLERHGHEELHVEAEEGELSRQNADHDERLTVKSDRPTDEIAIAAETALPESIRDDGDTM